MPLFQNITKQQMLLVGFIVVLLIAIPITLFLVKQKQNVKVGATKSTTMSFDPTQGTDAEVRKTVAPGDQVILPIYINPGTGDSANIIAVATIQITYDSTKLDLADSSKCIDTTGSPFQPINKGAVCTPGTALAYLAAGDIRTFVTQKTKVASITFKVKPDASGTTQVIFDQVNTLAGPATDKDPEVNVISQLLPATLTFGAGPTSILTPTPAPSAGPTSIPQPTATAPTPVQLPTCSSLTTDGSQSGTVPLSLNFTAIGADQFASITKATFNFGDNTVQDVAIQAQTTPVPTTASALTPTTTQLQAGASANSAQLSHTYNAPGTYQASVTFTDANNATSLTGNCLITVTVKASAQPTVPPNPTATPTLAPTGPGDTIVGVGLVGIVLTIAGGLLFFAL